jgi:hypothetical protein
VIVSTIPTEDPDVFRIVQRADAFDAAGQTIGHIREITPDLWRAIPRGAAPSEWPDSAEATRAIVKVAQYRVEVYA